jgi:very-short-patch-repair endonuclease
LLREGEVVLTYDTARTGSVTRARDLRRNSTDAERKLWRALRSKLPQHKWRRQMPVGPYFADFACFAEKLIVELDGGQHAEAADYDARRSAFLREQGYRVVRFWNDDVMANTRGVLERIAAELSTSPSHCSAMGPSLSHGRGEVKE